LRRAVHKTIRKVTEDIEERFHFNTAISAVMELVNILQAFEAKNDPRNAPVLREALESVVLLLAPFVPHATAELWEALGHETGIEKAGWPVFDPSVVADEELQVVVQVNGKLRSKVTVPVSAGESEVKEAALADVRVRPFIEGRTIRKIIYVPGKLINIVTD
jgi:leucyl-tRNA synthetase